jgi:Glycosyl hydrolase family 76
MRALRAGWAVAVVSAAMCAGSLVAAPASASVPVPPSAPSVFSAAAWPGLELAGSPVRLVSSTPASYASGYQASVANLDGLQQSDGEVTATPEAQAWVAVAFDATGNPARAGSALAWLLGQRDSDGSWADDTASTGVVLWALAEHARLGAGAAYLTANWPAIQAAAGYLVANQDQATGAIGPAGGPYLATNDGEALLGLQAAEDAAIIIGETSSASAWASALSRGWGGLEDDTGIAHEQTTDFFANALFDPDSGTLLQRREVAGASELALTYPGWGVKTGPGWYDGTDWVSAQATFMYVLAAVRNGLPEQAGSQYDGGLNTQCPDGSFGSQYHPPVGPQTGDYSSGPSCQGAQDDPELTALYLLATNALIGTQADPHLPPTWDTATVVTGGQTLTLSQRLTVDPSVPFATRRVAVIVGTSNGNESGIAMGAAYEALTQGYLPWIFWYLNSGDGDNGTLYSLSDLFSNLSRYSVIVIGDDALTAPSGGYACSGGSCASPTPLQYFTSNAAALTTWVHAGGRLISLGDATAAPLAGTLAAQTTAAPAPIEQVAFTGPAGSLRSSPYELSDASVSGWSPGTPDYYSSAGSYTVLAQGQSGGQPVPVMIGEQYGAGRVLQTTLETASAAHDFGPVAANELAWAMAGLPAGPTASTDAVSLNYGQLASQAAAAITPGWWQSSVSRYVAPPGVQDTCPDGYSSVWPVSQVYAAGLDLGSASLVDEANQALPVYYDAAVGAYQDCPPDHMFYYDDSGWLLNDMMIEYSQTHVPSLLQSSETIFSFLKTGWLKSGGEEFYKDCGCVEQVATGNFLQAALRLYQATGQASYLRWAQKIYAWDNANMQAGPSGNGLYYDTLTGSTLTDSIQFTYDTGVMLEADVLWYRVTRNRQYLVTAERLATAASAAFVDPADGVMAQSGASGPAFNSVYLQAAADLTATDGNPQWLRIGETSASAAVLWDQDRTSAGTTYGANWDGANAYYDPGNLDVLSQAGTARLFAILADARLG